MNRFKIKYILFLAFVVFSAFTVLDKQPFTEFVKERIQCYFASNEKLYLHINRNVFVSGEDVYFKAYLLKESNLQVDSGSKVLYIELIDFQNKRVFKTRSNIENGFCNGLVHLPDTLTNGTYNLIAYTNWMRNRDKAFYFSTNVLIVNQSEQNLDSLRCNSVKDQNSIIRFHPEGGTLVNGVKTKIGYQILMPEAIKDSLIQISDSEGNIIAKINKANQIGSFLFVPNANKKYVAQFHTKANKTIQYNISEVLKEGFYLTVNERDNQYIISVGAEFQNYANLDKLNLLIQSKGKLIDNFAFNLFTNSPKEFTIRKSFFPEGITQITLFDNANQALCERLVYVKHQYKISCNFNLSKNEFAKRENVEVKIRLTDENKNVAKGNFSVSVSEFNSAIKKLNYTSNIQTFINQRSDIPTLNELDMNSLSDEKLDELMIATQWTKFAWSDILHEPRPACNFYKETHGYILSGRVVNADNKMPAAKATILLTVPDSITNLKYCITDENGRFYFMLNKRYDNRELILHLKRDAYNFAPYKFELDDTESQSAQPFEYQTTDYDLKMYLTNSKKQALTGKIYPTSTLNTVNQVNTAIATKNTLYAKPDEVVYPSDFLELKDFDDIVTNLLPSVQFQKRNKSYTVHVSNFDTKGFFQQEPLILLNNTPINNAAQLAPLGTKQIKRIEMVNQPRLWGDVELYGVLSVFTHDNRMPESEFQGDMFLIKNNIATENNNLQFPVYDKLGTNKTKPDFRQTLYWNPTLRTDNDGVATFTFYTCDLQGKYSINIQGITNDGKPVSVTTFFDVK